MPTDLQVVLGATGGVGQVLVQAVLATWDIRSKKDGLGLLDHSFPWAQNSMEGQGEPVLLAGWREEDSIRQEQRILGSMRLGKP